jgi:hypothetical protein
MGAGQVVIEVRHYDAPERDLRSLDGRMQITPGVRAPKLDTPHRSRTQRCDLKVKPHGGRGMADRSAGAAGDDGLARRHTGDNIPRNERPRPRGGLPGSGLF